MKILKQKYHGLPGLGINGKTGKKGQNAQSIFFGYINDFFDGQKIDVKTYIYVAKRTFNHSNASDPELDASTLAAAWKVTQQELGVFENNTLKDAVNNSSLENNNSYIGIPNPNDFNYSFHKGKIEYSSMDACLSASERISLKDTVDIINSWCMDVVDGQGTVLGEYLYINCSSGNCNKYKDQIFQSFLFWRKK